MCGIVGLFLKDPGLEPALGLHLSRMLATMCDRGPDSAGLAVYGEGAPGRIKLTLIPAGAKWDSWELPGWRKSDSLWRTEGGSPWLCRSLFARISMVRA